ncbi:MAG: thiol-disulfide oxidoreductase DCC family protein [Gemmatimonadales bacterium]
MPLAADRANPTLIFDGECGICQQAVAILKRWDREHTLRHVPFQDGAAVARFGIALPALAAAMHLILPDGRVYTGADAVPQLLRLFPGTRWLAPLFRIPGVLPLGRRIYAWIAARRHCLVRGMEGR